MTDWFRVHDGKPAGGDGPGSGNPAARRRTSALCPIPLAALADELRFAFGPGEEKRIRSSVGFSFWRCSSEGGYLHTHPVLNEIIGVLALPLSSKVSASVSVAIHTRNEKAPEVEYALVLLAHVQPAREVVDRNIARALEEGGHYAGSEGAAAVAVIPADTEARLELELPCNCELSGNLILAVRPVADIVDHAYATWSDLMVLRAQSTLPVDPPDWFRAAGFPTALFHDLARLFDAACYLRSSGKAGRAALVDDVQLLRDYLTKERDPWSGPDPHPLFDIAHYARQVKREDRHSHPLVHYLTSGWQAELSPHPLFDVPFYASQSASLDGPALPHYLDRGWQAGLTPHRLFCPDFFIATAKLAQPLGEAPLLTYLRGGHSGDPHYLFDVEHYRRFQNMPVWDGIMFRYAEFNDTNPLPGPAELGGLDPLVHYVRFGSTTRQSPHFLFDPAWYAAERLKVQDLSPPSGDWDPLIDYLTTGARYGVSPSRLVDPDYYAQQTSLAQGEDCVGHYMLGARKDCVSLTPALDARFYTRRVPAALKAKSPLHHLLNTPAEQRSTPLAFFDPDFYLAQYPDIATENVCPIIHYLCFGAGENRQPNAMASDVYAATHIINDPQDLARPCFGYLRAHGDKRVRLLFTSHDASRSGAPAIILSLIRSFAEHGNAECITIVDRGGELLGEFQRHSHVLAMSQSVLEVGQQAEVHDSEIEGLLALLGDNPPVVALVNSAESRHLGRRLARHGIPVISLVHETPGYYPPAEFERIYASSRRVIFPSAYIDQGARAHCPYPEGLAMVRGQGLLCPGFGDLDRNQARRKVFQELGLGPDAALVIGCGAVDFRKGADLFLGVAAALEKRLRDKPGHRPVFFCWIGSGPDLDNLSREVERGKARHFIRFIGPKAEVERYFVAGDVFALTSRSDPFPCVVHEAMAAGMPVIGFEDGGGAPELFGAEAGITVPSGDVGLFAEAIAALVFDDARRQRMGSAARRIIDERGSNETYFQDLKRVASEVTGLDLETMLGERRMRGRRKVFILAPDWGVSGVNSFAETLVNGLNDRGFAAEILFTRGRFGYWETDRRGQTALPDAPYSRLEPADNTAAAIWQELQGFLSRQAPCVIIPNYDYLASAITPNLNSNVGVIGVLHSDDAEHYEHGYRLGRYWNRIVAVSGQIERRMLQLNPAFKERLRVLHCGVAPLADFDVAAKFPAEDEAIQIVFTGRFENYQKGIGRYVGLADRLARQGVKARLVMCGGGSQFAAIKAAMASHIRAGRVELTSRIAVSGVRDILRRSHAFVLLSDFEGLPVAMLEAMDAGCVPIVYEMQSGIPEVLRSSYNGLIVPQGDVGAVVEAIAGLRADRQAWSSMAIAARQSIRDLRLTQDDMSDDYAALISEVFDEIASGAYRRPPSLAYRAQIDGVLPPPALYDPKTAPSGM